MTPRPRPRPALSSRVSSARRWKRRAREDSLRARRRFACWASGALRLASHHGATNAAQSAFAAAFTAWETIRCPAAWLRRVAQRAHYRQAVSREIPVETAPDRPGPLSVTGAVEFRDEAREVLAALAELPARQRRLVSGPLMCLLWLE